MKKIATISILLLLGGCQAGIAPISTADNDQTQTWVFVTRPAGELNRNGIYHCSVKDGSPVCAKAKVKN